MSGVEASPPVGSEAPYTIEYGNLAGQYFTQWRIGDIEDMLRNVVYNYSNVPLVSLGVVKVWYDAREDYHRFEYQAAGNKIEVRYYKVWSSRINDRDGWVGCPKYCAGEFARHLRDHSRQAVQKVVQDAVEVGDGDQA